MQLKIKIEMDAAEETQLSEQKPPFDNAKIAKFILVVLLFLIAISYFAYRTVTSSPSIPSDVHKQGPSETKKPLVNTVTHHQGDSEPSIAQSTPELAQPLPVEEETHKKIQIESADGVEKLRKQTQLAKQESSKDDVTGSSQVAAPVPPTVIEKESSPVVVSHAKPIKLTQSSTHQPSHGSELNIHIVRAQLTSQIIEREPTDQLGAVISLAQGNRIYFFSEVRQLKGQQLFHRWSHDGEVLANVRLRIGADNWRTYSSKAFSSNMIGAWKVEVVNQQNEVIHLVNFDIAH